MKLRNKAVKSSLILVFNRTTPFNNLTAALFRSLKKLCLSLISLVRTGLYLQIHFQQKLDPMAEAFGEGL